MQTYLIIKKRENGKTNIVVKKSADELKSLRLSAFEIADLVGNDYLKNKQLYTTSIQYCK